VTVARKPEIDYQTGMGLVKLSRPLPPAHELEDAILALKRERRAVLLAHYYQESEIQDLADHVGDSLQLARAAKATDAEVIVFAGVHFMAETAKILNPDRIVVVPDLEAGCSLADGCPAPAFARWLEKYPGHVVVSYINCSAEVKALSDVICTSSNAAAVVDSFPRDQKIVFAPDRHLGRFVAKQTGRDDLVLWPGTCIVHETFSERKLLELKARHPAAEVIAHPECEEAILRHADFVGSTSALIAHARRSPAPAFIVATEAGILHKMAREAPGKTLIPAPPEDESCACNLCPHMRRNTLEKLYLCLRDLEPRIELDEGLRARALRPIERMLALSA
jgi:quinolinate synthase